MAYTLNEEARAAEQVGAGLQSRAAAGPSAQTRALHARPGRGRAGAGSRGAAAPPGQQRRLAASGRVQVTCSRGWGPLLPPAGALRAETAGGVRSAEEVPEATGRVGEGAGGGALLPHSSPGGADGDFRPASPSQGRGNRARGRRAREGRPDAQVRAVPPAAGTGTVGPGGCGPD